MDLENKKLEFSGAKNPLVKIKIGAEEAEVFKGGRSSIGGVMAKHQPFEKVEISLEEEACYYMFSDGYQDQFGGPQGRKFMKKRLRELLVEIHQKPMSEQKEILQSTLSEWMAGKESQVDDILVIGMRL
ncbi:MAG: SpoIIE family protein phosphatase [Bacteroidota bacterium]